MNRNRFTHSRFCVFSRFTWFLRFSRCLCFLILDRLADSRFDIIRFLFRSSIMDPIRFSSSEPDSKPAEFRLGLSETEFDLAECWFGSWSWSRSKLGGFWSGSSEPESELAW
uniref:Uncharacterized protein n=1 Tax=Opuntia streptacantha TaxID=393608 RepID=A0A7C9CMG3_OPUST